MADLDTSPSWRQTWSRGPSAAGCFPSTAASVEEGASWIAETLPLPSQFSGDLVSPDVGILSCIVSSQGQEVCHFYHWCGNADLNGINKSHTVWSRELHLVIGYQFLNATHSHPFPTTQGYLQLEEAMSHRPDPKDINRTCREELPGSLCKVEIENVSPRDDIQELQGIFS
ncbi:hypothetical protein P7K49_020579 [Saguinus oedipus]|uniref:Gelsolin-like domain-containing protein n=1 Tax=Saguinus oedipus TaxID=9490 RepID=A0ABQ9V111_SAGOE|nr:hypothetical protein P7K49_020579 [Saguinus oedipus]